MLIGWNWASQSHDITVPGDQGEVVERFAVSHDEAGFERAFARMRRQSELGSRLPQLAPTVQTLWRVRQ